MRKESITVFTAELARILLKEGWSIIDIKPDKMDEEAKRSLFVFRNDKGFQERLYELTH